MLALAATPSHDHSSAYASTVTSAPQPARSKPVARRAVSTASLKSAPRHPLAATTSTAGANVLFPKLVREGGVLPPRPRPEVEHAAKPNNHGSHHPKTSEPLHSQDADQAPIFDVEQYAPPLPMQSQQHFDIDKLPTTNLIRNLSAFLTKMATENDAKTSQNTQEVRAPNTKSAIWESLFTASQAAFSTKSAPMTFHARNIPTIALEAYLLRILRYCPCTNEVFLSLLVYFDRISKLSEETTGVPFRIDSYNVHRLVMAGVTVASKFFSDVFYTNSRYAKVGGLPLGELNQLELQFLLLIDFRLVISSKEMEHYAQQLSEHSHRQADSTPMQARSVSEQLPLAPPMMPTRPLRSMGAIDAYGGNIQNDQVVERPEVVAYETKNATPKLAAAINRYIDNAERRALAEEREQESSTYSETDTDAETDDEPTIKPSHSCGSSDTQSLFSNDASEASFDNNDDEDDANTTDDEHKTPERERSHHKRWDSGESTAMKSDRHMGNP